MAGSGDHLADKIGKEFYECMDEWLTHGHNSDVAKHCLSLGKAYEKQLDAMLAKLTSRRRRTEADDQISNVFAQKSLLQKSLRLLNTPR